MENPVLWLAFMSAENYPTCNACVGVVSQLHRRFLALTESTLEAEFIILAKAEYTLKPCW